MLTPWKIGRLSPRSDRAAFLISDASGAPLDAKRSVSEPDRIAAHMGRMARAFRGAGLGDEYRPPPARVNGKRDAGQGRVRQNFPARSKTVVTLVFSSTYAAAQLKKALGSEFERLVGDVKGGKIRA